MTSEETDKFVIALLQRITFSLEKLASTVDNNSVFNMRDTDRAKVYSEHLGKKLDKK